VAGSDSHVQQITDFLVAAGTLLRKWESAGGIPLLATFDNSFWHCAVPKYLCYQGKLSQINLQIFSCYFVDIILKAARLSVDCGAKILI
jgi:hypothetical protein